MGEGDPAPKRSARFPVTHLMRGTSSCGPREPGRESVSNRRARSFTGCQIGTQGLALFLPELFKFTDEEWGNIASAHAFAVQMAASFLTVSKSFPARLAAEKRTRITKHDANGRIAETVMTEVPDRPFPIGKATREFWAEATKTARDIDAAHDTGFGLYFEFVSAAIGGNLARTKALAKATDAKRFWQQVDYWHGSKVAKAQMNR